MLGLISKRLAKKFFYSFKNKFKMLFELTTKHQNVCGAYEHVLVCPFPIGLVSSFWIYNFLSSEPLCQGGVSTGPTNPKAIPRKLRRRCWVFLFPKVGNPGREMSDLGKAVWKNTLTAESIKRTPSFVPAAIGFLNTSVWAFVYTFHSICFLHFVCLFISICYSLLLAVKLIGLMGQ